MQEHVSLGGGSSQVEERIGGGGGEAGKSPRAGGIFK